MLVTLAPGQGAQVPGFLSPWLDLPGVADRLGWWSAVTGLDLVRYGTTAEAEEIRDTAVAQPLLVSAGLAAAEAVFGGLPEAAGRSGAVAGHSVGELTAAALAGVLSPEAALVFVRERGRGMAEAAAKAETGMTAVLGGDRDEVLAAIERHGLTPANDNGSGQLVAAGSAEGLAAFMADPPPRARLRALPVAGAFHTEHMAPAVERLASLAAGMAPADPATRLLSNRDGAVVDSGRELLERLVRQVSSPVRWDLCTETLRALGVTAIIELPPAGTLVGLAKRALPGVELLACKTPDDLDRAHELLARHAVAEPPPAGGGPVAASHRPTAHATQEGSA
ncbi:ACP S-malonyltransferase [Allonocardiopsis opalescens]|uniref:ACP S-malonyltransferase n=1 Tax=Allonocardiopsis opalescens TaxID=1144618 RepID=UPI000D06A925|nr:ACP S-malonyltransferase [Allonocardiopsis opalescens]